MYKYDLGIVILNYVDFNQTIKCVKNYLQQKSVSLYIVIIDNKSPNNSYDSLKHAFKEYNNVTVLSSHYNGGYAFGNNVGIRYCIEKGISEHVVISNNDVLLLDELLLFKWKEKHVRIDNVGLTSPVMQVKGLETRYSAWKMPRFWDDVKSGSIVLEKLLGDSKCYETADLIKDESVVDCLPGSLLMFDLDVMKDIGMFDEGTFLYMEEVILSKKLKEVDKTNYLITSLTYEHLYSATISSIYNDRNKRKIAFISKIHFALKYRKDNYVKIIIIILSYLLGGVISRFKINKQK